MTHRLVHKLRPSSCLRFSLRKYWIHHTKPMLKNQHKGYIGEFLAKNYLRRQGLVMITKNYRYRYGEIDLIMQHGNACVFIEVKSRFVSAFTHESLHVDRSKQKKIIQTSEHFTQRHSDYIDCPMRYDVVLINLATFGIRWYQNAFSPDLCL